MVRFWIASQSFSERTVHVFILCAFAITQPILGIFADYPQFFAARGTSPVDIVLWLLILVFAVPLCLSFMLSIVGVVSRSIELTLFYLLLVFLVTLIVIPPLTREGFDSGLFVLLGSMGVGVTFLLIYLRFEQIRKVLNFMVIAIVAFPLLFIFHPNLGPLIFKSEYETSSPESSAAPINVVMVVFDELPLFTLLNERREINELRYPNFASLASTSTWYRNATTVAEMTHEAIPAILTGQRPAEKYKLPVYVNFSRNLFTLLGNTHHINASEGLGALCPQYLCGEKKERLGERLLSLLADSFFVYAHIVIPSDFAESLPAIDQNWQDFAQNRGDFFELSNPKFIDIFVKKPKDAGTPDILGLGIGGFFGPVKPNLEIHDKFSEFTGSIRKIKMPRLDYLHIIYPHVPLTYLPSGRAYNGTSFQERDGLVGRKWSSRWPAVQGLQRALLQLGGVDALLGQLTQRLDELGLFDETLLIITSDHGASYRALQERRLLTESNYMDMLPVPLFIKFPEQKKGVIDDSNVELIDILPTVADALELTIPYKVDGHSLLNEERPARMEKRVRLYRDRSLVIYPPVIDFVGVDNMIDLFGERPEEIFLHGPNSQLIGRSVKHFKQGESPPIELELSTPHHRIKLDPGASQIPARVFGTFHGTEETRIDQKLPLAVAINGTIAATTWSYQAAKKWVFSALLPEHSFVSGNNEIEIFAIEHSDKEIRLVRFPLHSS